MFGQLSICGLWHDSPFLLDGKVPPFQSNDDAEALLEMACIIGRRWMEKAATLHGERLTEAHPVPYINSVLQPGHSPQIFHQLQQGTLVRIRRVAESEAAGADSPGYWCKLTDLWWFAFPGLLQFKFSTEQERAFQIF
jgi:hypothetical protein